MKKENEVTTFNSKYSTWYSPLDLFQQKQYKDLESLVLTFNENLKYDVIRAKEKYNVKIRGVIADKTGFSLNHKTQENNRQELYIPIRIVDRVPLSLLKLFEKYNYPDIDLLLRYRGMKHAANELEYQIKHYADFSKHHRNKCREKEIENSLNHLNILIKRVEESGILSAIQELGPDLLGAYYLHKNEIELYWLCIGLCSIIHDLPVEDFCLVVLTHELVHGYTHIGHDKDGNHWDTSKFGNADLKIVEGFAQFYTEMLCKDYFPQAKNAFNALLTKQREEYLAYKNWFVEKESDKYEKARRILLKTRNSKILDYKEFGDQLKKIKEDFK